MGKKYLIDTNTILEYISGDLPHNSHLFINRAINDIFNISIVNKIEVLGHISANQALIDFIDLANTIELTAEITAQTIELRKTKKIKLPDAIIAATALVHNLTIISRNVKDFQGIDDLDCLNSHEI